MSSGIPRAGRWPRRCWSRANSLADQLSNRHRPAVVAFLLCFAAIFVLGFAAATMVRVAPTPQTGCTSDADMSIERMVSAPPRM
jgi:hypothetical protein